MQDRNDFLEVVSSRLGAFDDLAKEPMPEGATSRTIGLWPQKGDVIKLRGLDFQIRFSSERTGELRLALVRAVEQRNEAVGTVGEHAPINEQSLDELDGRWNCPNCETTKIKADYKQCPICDTARPGPRR